MSCSPLNQKNKFQQDLIDWYEAVAKDYPWRNTQDPWAILISEVMLQQTQVATVLNKKFFTNFLSKFPTPAAIASASEQDILSAWEGLGYYRRVRNLQKTAIEICDKYGGVFPTQYEDILNLPGIGRYTAGAVSSFAYNAPQPIVDANVARIFSRLFDYQKRIDNSEGTKQLWQWAEELLGRDNPRIYNSALMELGQQVCTNKAPKCQQCVIRPYCKTNEPEQLPIKKAAKKTVLVDEFALFCIHPQNGILLQQENDSKRRAGMWQLPLRDHSEIEHLPLLQKTTYAITHHKVTLRIYLEKNLPIPRHSEQWHSLASLESIPMPSPFRKALNSLLKDHI